MLQSIILGVIQGLTEFLPVSSSAHLIVVPWLLRWPDRGLAFDVALHLGTLVALLAYYWRDWLDLGLSLFTGNSIARRMLALVAVASVPGAVIGVMLEKFAESKFRAPLLVGIDIALLGIVLWLSDKYGNRRRRIADLSYTDALLIGLAQAAAIIPGVSRSGATISAARMMGISREESANFSFLMATPIIAGAGMLELHKALAVAAHREVATGFIASAVFGFAAIGFVLRYVRTHSYRPFAIYRLILGAAVVATALVRG
jgi:undecaprenyl-diphosphatase